MAHGWPDELLPTGMRHDSDDTLTGCPLNILAKSSSLLRSDESLSESRACRLNTKTQMRNTADSESTVRKVRCKETSRRSSTRSKGGVCFRFRRDGECRHVLIAQDIEPHYSDAVMVSEPDARDYSDALPEHPLPGSGELLDDCGEDIPALFCSDCGTPYEVGRTCRRSRCPRCWQSWVFHRAKSVASKVEALGRHLYSQEGKQVKQHHLTVSLANIDVRFNSKDPLKQGVEAIKPLLSKVNVETGYIIYHPFRIAPEYRGDVLGHESGDGDMTWKDVLSKVESDSWTWEAVREEFLVFEPHFHVIALSEFVDCTGVGDIEDKTGVVIHRITTRRDDGKERSIDGIDELAKVTAYSLSHAGLAPESGGESFRAAIRPFGRVANFEAWDRVKGEVTAALRKVSKQVLGFSFGDSVCSEHVHEGEDDDADMSRAARTLASGGGMPNWGDSPSSSAGTLEASTSGLNDDTSTWDATAGSVPSGLAVVSDGGTERCDGQLVPMWKASEYLGSLEWLNAIERRFSDGEDRLRRLRDSYEEWDEMGRPRPVEVDSIEDLQDDPPG